MIVVDAVTAFDVAVVSADVSIVDVKRNVVVNGASVDIDDYNVRHWHGTGMIKLLSNEANHEGKH